VSKSDSSASKSARRKYSRWVLTIFLVTIFISGGISALSDIIMESTNVIVAFVILLVIILVGVAFDVVGMAVASADEKPFHSMAARKVPGSMEAIALLHNAERVSSICNDVIGDICGVVSGGASATIALQIIQNFDFSWPQIVSLLMSALAAGLTVGGKAVGKSFAVNSSTEIVHSVGKIIAKFRAFTGIFRKKQ